MSESEPGRRTGLPGAWGGRGGKLLFNEWEFIWERMKKYGTWIVVTATPLGMFVVWVGFMNRVFLCSQTGLELPS